MGGAMSPGLRQAVVCPPDEDGRLLWWWVWSGPIRDGPSEDEPLGLTADVEVAAHRIVSVLRLEGIRPEATA
ncbi:hypothetical protein [Actinoallomurus rhizosphaericola]|uniref:hypothetical protein n=1 Tax=Actinoallomurus rhizosphaericola TaxID=2952536 RepID=UPI002092A9A8|nr:hypothetical protein [Actinoallomurus rhizosphaericola]MCO5997392.1 hypothetical protein [Actinoallomurus rhizosphaericola]